jgi:hypothetical protein
MDMNDRASQITNQITLNKNSFKVYHQNVRSLRKKNSHELLGHLYPVLPHVVCLTDHNLNIVEKTYVNIEGYTIGAQFCRVLYEKVGVIVYVHVVYST